MVKILLDTADIEKIKNVTKYYDIVGVTTNPTILANTKKDLKTVLLNLKEFTYNKYEIHIQTTEKTADKIVEEAKKLRLFFGKTFFIKIPLTKEGLEAIKMCKNIGINVTATAILSQTQALAAAKQGANYVAPYINRLENINVDSKKVIEEIKYLLKDYDTEILAASFKNVSQFKDIMLKDAEAITIAPEILSQSIWHPYTDKSVEDFNNDWHNKYANNKIIDFI